MKARAVVATVCVAAGLSIGCTATTRYEVLSFFFDGVPPPPVSTGTGEGQAAETSENAVQSRRAVYGQHGPYAARMCNACHQSAATNALVAPREELCFNCHEFPLDKRYIHGPLAAGGCTVCHDPHSSQYRYLLVSESDGFCFHCHDSATIARIPAHDDAATQCTGCHNAHLSDKKYLLR